MVNHQVARQSEYIDSAVLYMGMELSAKMWVLAFSVGAERVRSNIQIPAGDRKELLGAIERAKKRFGLPDEARVRSCHEAGRDGFWVHRLLVQLGIENVVIDPASIKVSRKMRRAKTDRIDAVQMLADLVRFHRGQRDVFKVVRVPTPEQEDARRLHREIERLKKERRQHQMRIRSLATTQGVRVGAMGRFLRDLDQVTIWDGSPLPPWLRGEIKREGERLAQTQEQILHLEKQRDAYVEEASDVAAQKIQRLASLRGIGIDSAWLLGMELFAWRQFDNRKQVGASAGLTGTPYNTGDSRREQGISKAGSPMVRQRMIELAWLWLRLQPRSQISLWFKERFAATGSRNRRVGIVAVARKLLIDLWRFVENDVVPPGASLKPLPTR